MSQRPGYTITDEAAGEPLELEDLRTFVKQDEDEDNALIEQLITAARIHVERTTRRSIMRRTVAATFDHWPVASTVALRGDRARLPALLLPLAAPLIVVRKVEYVDLNDATQTLATTVYKAVTNKLPGRIRLRRNQSWPDTVDDEEAITITYDVGYESAADVPEDIKVAIRFLVAHWYQNREAVDVSVGGTVTEVPQSFGALVAGLKVPKVD